MTALLLTLALAWLGAGPVLPIRPDPALTPGVVLTTSVQAVCTPGYAARVRHVTAATKRSVFRRYGLAYAPGFEVDHLISLELGGSNALENLWPESYSTPRWNARTKDRLENRLHWLACHRGLPLVDAQAAIRTDWIAAYEKFVVRHAVR